MNRAWRLADSNNHYYHHINDGRVVGHVFNYAHSIVWGAKVPSPVDYNEEMILGRYIEMEFAKRAVEEYWNERDRTLHPELNKLLTKD